nr:sporulation histidine kinase inhibitor Sda [Fredinandcohnia onubensis]
MEMLSDEELLKIYQLAKEQKLDEEFIELLKNALKKRQVFINISA